MKLLCLRPLIMRAIARITFNSSGINLLQIGVLLIATLTLTPIAANANTESYSMQIEKRLNRLFAQMQDNQLPAASNVAAALAQDYPDFALGQLLHAEFMAMQSLDETLVGSDADFSPRLIGLLMEAQTRLKQSSLNLDDRRLPDNLLQLGRNIKHVVAVDLDYSRLYLIDHKHGRARVTTSHYAASGRGGYGKLVEGDLRTPTGVYSVTQFRPGKTLPDLYGSGALTLNYPNALDRHYNRTGYGIWLHGVPEDNLSRAPRSSEGCVVMPNDLLTQLHQSLDLDATLVVLSGQLQWRRPQTLNARRDTFIQLFSDWKNAVLRDDHQKLAELHAQARYQRVSSRSAKPAAIIADHSRLEKVAIEDVTILSYPPFPGDTGGEKIMMQFPLPPDSSRRDGKTRHMTLYWEVDHTNRWRISHLKEGAGPV